MIDVALQWVGGGSPRAVARLIAFGLSFVVFSVAAGDAGVVWKGGRLSVQAGNQSIGAVLKDIQARTGIAVTSYDPLSAPVARSFERLPLAVGLKTLLSQYNHMIIEGAGRRPLRVYVLGVRAVVVDISSENSGAAAAVSAAHSTLPAALTSADAAARIEAVERLADLSDAASLAALRHATNDLTEAVRVVAQQALAARLAKPSP